MNDYAVILKKSREAAAKFYRQQMALATSATNHDSPESEFALEFIDQ